MLQAFARSCFADAELLKPSTLSSRTTKERDLVHHAKIAACLINKFSPCGRNSRVARDDGAKKKRGPNVSARAICTLKLILHPQQTPNTTTVYGQYFTAGGKVVFGGKVVQGVQHFAGVNGLYQYAGIGYK